MKKREWDKDIFNYDKAREWLGKNHLPVLFFLAILATPVLFIAVRYAVTHFPAIPDALISDKIGNAKVDFVTPALYYFSSIAQTMGAIIGLALAAMYAIMPNIRSSKDNPAFEPARRLLQRDEYFRRSINVGSVCILVSLLGLLFIYVTASSQSWAFVLLLLLGVTALGLGVYSLGTMFYFIRVRMPKYFSPVEILEFAYLRNYSNLSRKNINDIYDLCEISLLSEANGNINNTENNSIFYLYNLKNNFCYKPETFLGKLVLWLNTDMMKSGLNKDARNNTLLKIISILWHSLITSYSFEKTSQIEVFYGVVNFIKNEVLYSNNSIYNNYFGIFYDNNGNLFNDIIYPYIHIDNNTWLREKNNLMSVYFDLLIQVIEFSKINYICDNKFFNELFFKIYFKNLDTYKSLFYIYPNLKELIVALFVKYEKELRILIYDSNYKDRFFNKTYKFINFKYQFKFLINIIENLFKLKIIKINDLISEYRDDRLIIFNIILTISNVEFDESEYNNLKDLPLFLHKLDFTYLYNVFKIFQLESNKFIIRNPKDFIYFYFIPYLERHGINVNDNPEYMAIIRKRIKDIKEPELDF